MRRLVTALECLGVIGGIVCIASMLLGGIAVLWGWLPWQRVAKIGLTSLAFMVIGIITLECFDDAYAQAQDQKWHNDWDRILGRR